MTTNEDFFKNLSGTELEGAAAIESELMKRLQEGLPEDVDMLFVRTVLAIRTIVPDAVVVNVFDEALREGLVCLLRKLIDPKQTKATQSGVRRVRGVRGV